MKIWIGVILAITLTAMIGCSTGTDMPTSPVGENVRGAEISSNHHLFGLYQFVADPEAGSLDFYQLRVADMHLNALPFLEPPPLLNLTLESLEFNGNIIDADIGLRHPFLGLQEFTGFDVCGILISNGSIGGFTDHDLLLPGPDDLHLVNPDGFSRWWNPAEFPVNLGTMFSYNDGLLGAPDSYANYSATLNGYKYFTDELNNPEADLSTVDPTGRGIFSAGQKNVRHYTIDMGTAGLIFNYAIDASWMFPSGDPPWSAPDDFPPGANRPEAWNISVGIVEDTLWNDGVDNGGDLSLQIDVYDWFNAGMNSVTVESPGNFNAASSATPSGGGIGYSTYEIDIIDATPAETGIDIFITVECEAEGYDGLLPGKMQAVYFMSSAPVDDEAPVTNEWPEEWSCYQYNSANIGRNPNTQDFDANNFSQLWYKPLSGFFKIPGPVVTENYIYHAVCLSFYSTSSNHNLYCLDINDNGNTVWQHNINPTADYGRAMTGPVWFDDGEDGRIVIGGDRVWCLDALTGAVEWEYGGSAYLCVRPNPKFYNDRIYIALGGEMHCIDAYTGANVWTSDPALTGSETVPAVADDKVYFARGTTFTCLNADTGAIVWQTPGVQGQSHWDAPLVVNGRVYMASYNQWLGCLDADDGTLYWTFTESTTSPWITGLTYWIDPSDDNVVVYLGGAFSNGSCRAVKDYGSYGAKLWQSAAHYFDGSPVFNEGTIYIGDTSGTLYGYDAETGATVFTQSISGGTRGAVGFAYGRMAVMASNGIYCFESP